MRDTFTSTVDAAEAFERYRAEDEDERPEPPSPDEYEPERYRPVSPVVNEADFLAQPCTADADLPF